jgi:tRNA(Ile)-lysidine synthase
MEFTRFTNAVRQTAIRYGMDLDRPLVLVSGGPDSVALLRVILDLDGEPAALHVDHGLREESREDEEFVSGLCSRLGVRCEVRRLRFEKGAICRSGRGGNATGSRRRWPASSGLRTVATGHTADDVAETVLMNLARGTGLRGLAGIPPVRGAGGAAPDRAHAPGCPLLPRGPGSALPHGPDQPDRQVRPQPRPLRGPACLARALPGG